MATCRVLHALGPPYILRHGVTLRTRSQMVSFVSFILADIGRLAYMHFLDLGAKVFEPLRDGAKHGSDASFTDLLTRPEIVLKTLTLHDMEKMLACNPHLPAAIGALSTLKHLSVHGVGRAAIVALRTMRSQLVSATIALMGPLSYYPALHGHSAFSDVFSTLQLSADTLQELDLSLGIPVNSAHDILVSCQFPHVRTLRTVLDTHFPQCTLLRLFPNLENLHLGLGTRCFGIAEDVNAVSFMVAIREVNSKIGLSPSLKLLECSGEVASLYTLTAHLTVSRLRIYGHVGRHELPFFRVVLAEAQPAELELDVHGSEVVEELVGILRELEPRTMDVLTLNVSFWPGDGEQVVAEVRQLTFEFLYASNTCFRGVSTLPSTACCR